MTSTRDAEALDLVEHVARHDDAAALGAEALEEVDEVEALAGVEPGERLVEHDDLGVGTRAWATFTRWRMPLEKRADGRAVVGVELDQRRGRPGRRASGSASLGEHGGEVHELEGGQPLEERPPAGGPARCAG